MFLKFNTAVYKRHENVKHCQFVTHMITATYVTNSIKSSSEGLHNT